MNGNFDGLRGCVEILAGRPANIPKDRPSKSQGHSTSPTGQYSTYNVEYTIAPGLIHADHCTQMCSLPRTDYRGI